MGIFPSILYTLPDNTPGQQKRQISEPTETAVDQPKQPAGSTGHTKRHRRAVVWGQKISIATTW